jgi:short-subunit dehydrogenase
MSEYLRGKSAVVTGASSGIGREIALGFAREGANVLAVARRQEKLKEVEKSADKMDGSVVIYSCDIRENTSADLIIENSLLNFGSIDILVNNAAIGMNKQFSELSQKEIINVIQTNLLAPAFLSQKVLPIMIENQSGHLIFITSLAGKLGFPGLSTYSASKFGIEGLAETIRHEVHKDNIAVTVLRPGVTDTEFFENANMNEFHQQAKNSGKMHSAAKVANELIDQIEERPNEIVVGNDKWFLRIMPFVPERFRFAVLDLFT